MFAKLAVRDLAIVAAALGLWWWAAPRTAADDFVSDFLGLLAGLGLGVSTYLLHEWGHALGGFATRSTMRPAASLRSRYLFSFDSRANTRRQFLVMSVGGFIVTGVAVWVAYGVLPGELLATRVARGAILFLTALTVVIEFPLVGWALLRSDLPPVETFDSPFLNRQADQHRDAA